MTPLQPKTLVDSDLTPAAQTGYGPHHSCLLHPTPRISCETHSTRFAPQPPVLIRSDSRTRYLLAARAHPFPHTASRLLAYPELQCIMPRNDDFDIRRHNLDQFPYTPDGRGDDRRGNRRDEDRASRDFNLYRHPSPHRNQQQHRGYGGPPPADHGRNHHYQQDRRGSYGPPLQQGGHFQSYDDTRHLAPQHPPWQQQQQYSYGPPRNNFQPMQESDCSTSNRKRSERKINKNKNPSTMIPWGL